MRRTSAWHGMSWAYRDSVLTQGGGAGQERAGIMSLRIEIMDCISVLGA